MGRRQSGAKCPSDQSAVASTVRLSIQVPSQQFMFASLVDLLRNRGISLEREYELTPQGDGARPIV
jgi:hypothetical protein